MAKSPTKEVATSEKKELQVSSNPFAAHAGAGLENVKASDLLVPRLTIIQALSPQLKPNKAEFIPGAKVGDICDVATGDLFDEVLFLPVHYRKDYIEWAPRSSGKGLVEIHSSPEILREAKPNEKKQPTLPNGNTIQETAQFFGINLSANNRLSFIGFASTQLKKARKWLMLATGEEITTENGTFTAPMFYRTYKLTGCEESNAEGDWIGWRITRGLALPDLDMVGEKPVVFADLFNKAVSFHESLLAGDARADMSDIEASSDSGSSSTVSGEDIPF